MRKNDLLIINFIIFTISIVHRINEDNLHCNYIITSFIFIFHSLCNNSFNKCSLRKKVLVILENFDFKKHYFFKIVFLC